MKLHLLILLAMVGTAQADQIPPTEFSAWPKVYLSSGEVALVTGSEWVIHKGSQTYLLDEFVKSGRFCEATRHIWKLYYDHYNRKNREQRYFMCLICGKKRKLLKSTSQEEWEP